MGERRVEPFGREQSASEPVANANEKLIDALASGDMSAVVYYRSVRSQLAAERGEHVIKEVDDLILALDFDTALRILST